MGSPDAVTVYVAPAPRGSRPRSARQVPRPIDEPFEEAVPAFDLRAVLGLGSRPFARSARRPRASHEPHMSRPFVESLLSCGSWLFRESRSSCESRLSCEFRLCSLGVHLIAMTPRIADVSRNAILSGTEEP